MSTYKIRRVATPQRLAWLRECRDHAPADRAGWHHTANHCARLGWTQWSMISDGSIVGEELTDEGRAVLAGAKEERPMDLDYEFDERECLKCGYCPTHFRHCRECHGEGEFDCYDDDPINFSPGEEFETCETCSGSGIEHWCPKCGADQEKMRLEADQRTRICCNADCGWTCPGTECVYPHHWPKDRLCPKCNETTEVL